MQTAVDIAMKTRAPRFAVDFKNRWLTVAMFVLVVAVYMPVLIWTGRVIFSNEDMAYAAFAPVLSLYIAFQKRKELLASNSSPNAWGVLILIAAGLLSLVGTLGDSSTVMRLAFLASLAGCILAVGGLTALSILKFPLLLLLFIFPIPPVIYAQITAPLQSLATGVSQFFLEVLGFSTLRDGNLLEFPHYRLSVVEACSGIRSLMTLFFFCLLYAYLLEKKLLPRLALSLLSIPCALFLNVVRITITGILGEYQSPLSRGIYHEILGWICLFLGFVLVLAIHRALRYVRRRTLLAY
jgi:exosortase